MTYHNLLIVSQYKTYVFSQAPNPPSKIMMSIDLDGNKDEKSNSHIRNITVSPGLSKSVRSF